MEHGGVGAERSSLDILFNAEFLHSQLFWVAVSFAVLMVVVVFKALPAMVAMLDERANKISKDLTDAEKARESAEKSFANYEAKLAKAQEEAADIISKSRDDAKALVGAKMAKMDVDIARKREDANKAIEASKQKAMRDLQGQVAEIAVQVTEKLLSEMVDSKKAQAITNKAVKQLLN